jgi:hypothetical protein
MLARRISKVSLLRSLGHFLRQYYKYFALLDSATVSLEDEDCVY